MIILPTCLPGWNVMNSLSLEFLDKLSFTAEEVGYLRSLGEYQCHSAIT